MAKTKARVTAEHYVDIRLWRTATYLLDVGIRRKRGRFHPLLAASVFAFFAFEAYLNEVGRQLEPDAWRRERELFARGKYRGTLGKFRYLSEKTGYSYSSGTRPYQTICELSKVRDALAHGRTEMIDVTTSVVWTDAIGLEPSLIEWGQVSYAKRAVADVKAIADGLMAAAKTNRGVWAAGFRSSAFVGVSSVHEVYLEK